MASHHLVLEGDGENLRSSLHEYYATISLLEDGIPRFVFWHFYGKGSYLVYEELRCFRDIWDPRIYECFNWEDVEAKFTLAKIYHDFWIKLLAFYKPFRDMMLS